MSFELPGAAPYLGEPRVLQVGVGRDEFISQVLGLQVKVTPGNDDVTVEAGHLDELSQLVGLRHAVRDVVVVILVILSVQLR